MLVGNADEVFVDPWVLFEAVGLVDVSLVALSLLGLVAFYGLVLLVLGVTDVVLLVPSLGVLLVGCELVLFSAGLGASHL